MVRAAFVFLLFVVPSCSPPKVCTTPTASGARRARAPLGKLGEGVPVVFLEPVGSHRLKRPTYRRITEPKKLSLLRRYMDNEAAGVALELFRLAQEVDARRTSAGGATRQPFYIALVRGGNHAAQGFKLVDGAVTKDHARAVYVKLGFRAKRFRTTLLHETGHVVLGILSRGQGVPTKQIASLPHSTAALTDRGTALNEGFAIALETLIAHRTSDSRLKAFYQHREPSGGRRFLLQSHYFFRLKDMMSYAQSFGRYVDVRDNAFSFQTALTQGDYYRVQLDRSRNQALLRSADQLLASEGFYATFFFRQAAPNLPSLTRKFLGKAYGPIFVALALVLSSRYPVGSKNQTPFLGWSFAFLRVCRCCWRGWRYTRKATRSPAPVARPRQRPTRRPNFQPPA